MQKSLKQELEERLVRLTAQVGADDPAVQQVKRQLDAINSGLPQSAKATFLMGAKTVRELADELASQEKPPHSPPGSKE